MDFKKLITISLKDVRITFGDRNLLLIMILAPLALTLIIGAAFSKFTGGGNDLPVEKPNIAVVNEDTGNAFGNFGKRIVDRLIPTDSATEGKTAAAFVNAQIMSRTDAISAVDKGTLVAAILIPKDFSTSLASLALGKPSQTKITFYQNAGSPISASIAASVVRGVVNSNLAGSIAVALVIKDVPNGNALALAQGQTIGNKVGQSLQTTPPIQLNTVTISGQNPGATSDPLQYFAPSMAVFFLTFTMAGGVVGIIEERDKWTLQRLLSSPTSRLTILAGKFGGTYINGVLQLAVLIVATSLIGPVLGSKASVWGNNIPGIALITLSAVAAAVGLGTLIAGFARTAQQADTAGNAVLILAGILGGSFFNVASFGSALQIGSKLTLNYWATNAYNTLSQTGDIGAILPNIAALLLMFVVYFGIGVVLFNRRLDV